MCKEGIVVEEADESLDDDGDVDAVYNLIDSLHRAHLDNSKYTYLARLGGTSWSIMPATPFVFDFFIYNSIYQVDWELSLRTGRVCDHPEGMTESKMQTALEKLLRTRCQNRPEILTRAFQPVAQVELQGDWTAIRDGTRISPAAGEGFFHRMRKIQDRLQQAEDGLKATKAVFDLISECRYFVYMVRNNIFHGSKRLGDLYDATQRRRLEIYDLFLRCLVSLFFLAVGKREVASDTTQIALRGSVLPAESGESADEPVLKQETLIDTVNYGLMKPADCFLIPRFTRLFTLPKDEPPIGSALFYPGAAKDLITPLILGLPYCRDFYFYALNDGRKPTEIKQVLPHVRGIRGERTERREPFSWVTGDSGEHILRFFFNGIERRIFWLQRDNQDFLDRQGNMAFFFHRYDGSEGGSEQPWETDWLDRLAFRVGHGNKAVFFTSLAVASSFENRLQTLVIPGMPKYRLGWLDGA